jgi:hypothetical protein
VSSNFWWLCDILEMFSGVMLPADVLPPILIGNIVKVKRSTGEFEKGKIKLGNIIMESGHRVMVDLVEDPRKDVWKYVKFDDLFTLNKDLHAQIMGTKLNFDAVANMKNSPGPVDEKEIVRWSAWWETIAGEEKKEKEEKVQVEKEEEITQCKKEPAEEEVKEQTVTQEEEKTPKPTKVDTWVF